MLAALLLSAALAGPPVPPVRTDYLRAEETLPPLSIVAGLDLWSTGYAVRLGGRELHPWLQTVEERAASQLMFVGASMFVVHEVDRRWGRKAGKRTLLAIVAIKLGAVAWNVHVGRR